MQEGWEEEHCFGILGYRNNKHRGGWERAYSRISNNKKKWIKQAQKERKQSQQSSAVGEVKIRKGSKSASKKLLAETNLQPSLAKRSKKTQAPSKLELKISPSPPLPSPPATTASHNTNKRSREVSNEGRGNDEKDTKSNEKKRKVTQMMMTTTPSLHLSPTTLSPSSSVVVSSIASPPSPIIEEGKSLSKIIDLLKEKNSS